MLARNGRLTVGIFTLMLASALAVHAIADEAKGSLDWGRRIITAKGSGAPDLRAPNIAVARLGAERAAKMDAMRNILETLKGVHVTSGQTVGAVIETNSAVRARVQGLLKNFKVIDTRYFSDGGVEVDVEMKLDGELGKVLIPETERKTLPTTGEKKYTGLIVDAKGKQAVPALAPRILDEAGVELYTAAFVSQDAIKERGVAAYGKSVNEAKSEERVGDHPLVIKALRADGSDIVITNADASPFTGGEQSFAFLAEGRVLIVID